MGLNFSKNKPNFYIFLLCPLYDLILLFPLLHLFRKIKKRDPKNAPRQFIPYNDGLWPDRWFDSIALIVWIFIPLGLLTYYYT
jgi:hypothetical protein